MICNLFLSSSVLNLIKTLRGSVSTYGNYSGSHLWFQHKMIRKVGVISDTHIPHFKKLPEAIWEHFAGVELIIHAGDLSVLSVLNELEAIAPVVAVQGNVEEEEVIAKLPIKCEVMVGHCRIGIVHILGDSATRVRLARQELPNARCVVF